MMSDAQRAPLLPGKAVPRQIQSLTEVTPGFVDSHKSNGVPPGVAVVSVASGPLVIPEAVTYARAATPSAA